jgi:uncharacterized protein YecE (DUF72 family)
VIAVTPERQAHEWARAGAVRRLRRMLADARVGTSGFAYREWVGTAYPRGAAPSQLLPLYADRLPVVEIASTFTRIPQPEQLASWAAQVPAGFEFALKAPARVAQDLKLGRSGARALEHFLVQLEPLSEHLGPILVQVPDKLSADRRGLAEFLGAAPRDVRLAMEFRHPSWRDDATLRLLSAYNVALVLSDWGGAPPRIELTADFAYVRIRRDDDAPEVWNEWAERIAALTRRGVDVYAFLKHDRKGLAVERAMRLASLCRAEYAQGEQPVLT